MLCNAGTILNRLFPFVRKNKPALVRLGSDMRYSEIIQEVNRDAAAALFAVLGAVAAVALKLAKVY